MKQILIIGLTMLGLISCNNQNQDNSNVVVDTKEIRIEKLCRYSNTPQGISIITIADGTRFIYCETSHGVAVAQIMENGEISTFHTETTPTDSIVNY